MTPKTDDCREALKQASAAYEAERARYLGGIAEYEDNQSAFIGCMEKAVAAWQASREQPAGDMSEVMDAYKLLCKFIPYGGAEHRALDTLSKAALTTPAAPVDAEVEEDGITQRLLNACVGWPNTTISWPHRLLHEARDEIEKLRAATKPAAQTVPQEVVDALKFYASRKTYRDEAFVDRGDGTHDQSLAILADEGYTARKALALLTDGKDKP
jgi:NAD(P)-dependent dehydrogenase (short-subunit alcohol dehydrogenase family)